MGVAGQVRVGGDVDSMCTRCKMLLSHTILAMVEQRPARVQCNTCGGQHNYKSPAVAVAPRPRSTAAGAKPSATRGRAATPAGRTVVDDGAAVFESQLAHRLGSIPGAPPVYSPRSRYLVDDLIVHPTFGTGFVVGVRADKIDVQFRGGGHTLVHGRA